MKKFLTIIPLVCLLSSCNFEQPDTTESKISKYLSMKNPGIEFSVTRATLEREVTFGQEMDRVRHNFEEKVKMYSGREENYKDKAMYNHMSLNREQKEEYQAILERMDAYMLRHAQSRDSILVRVYCFDAQGSNRTSEVTIKDAYAVFSPDGEILFFCLHEISPYVQLSKYMPLYKEQVLLK